MKTNISLHLKLLLPMAAALGIATVQAAEKWHPAQGPLMTRWAKDVSPKNALPEYPRPQMVRKDWQNLNGLWDYAIAGQKPEARSQQPERWDGQILVPFPIESALSGVMKRVYETSQLWYHRMFTIPKSWQKKNILLHFGAVDWETTVYVNGKEVGSHRGGYDGFSFDITDALKPSGEQEIVVSVLDPTDAGTQPHGKQMREPHGIWYTPTSGIWQTVWLEPVNKTYIESLKITPDVDAQTVRVDVKLNGRTVNTSIEVAILDGKKVITKEINGGWPPTLTVSQPKLWSPDSPLLYGLRVTVRTTSFPPFENGEKVDEVESYFAMRKISLGKDDKGFTRILLNNKPLFQFGPLDQGFWPDGLYTAPTDEALRYDIEMTKKLGFNMARKHVKVEPERWYYWCDKLGLLVWQDLPSGDKHTGRQGTEIQRTEESARQYEVELKAMIEGRGNHPCIVLWVPFNEGWGQFDTARITDLVKKWDPSRLAINASGWIDRGVGDVNDMHKYPGPAAPQPEEKRAGVLGEFGGLGLPVKGHTWQNEKNWGYKSFTNSEALTTTYVGLVEQLPGLIKSNGLSAAVYTQTTDVEVEVNGLMTYDRAMVKPDAKRITAANKKVYSQPAKDAAQK